MLMKSKKALREALEKQSEKLGAREIGVVQTDSLKDSAELYAEVMRILPEAKSAVSFISPFPKGTLHLLKDPSRGMPFYTRIAGIGARVVDELSVNISNYLERQGFLAAPVFVCTPLEMRGKLDLWGYVSQIDIAAKSGLGWKGKNGLLISPEYGPRIGVGTVLTDAPLQGDKPSKQTCPDECLICVEACPSQALDGTGRVNRLNCTLTQAMAPLSIMMTKEFSMKDHRDMIVNVGGVDEHTWYKCNACVVNCPIGL